MSIKSFIFNPSSYFLGLTICLLIGSSYARIYWLPTRSPHTQLQPETSHSIFILETHRGFFNEIRYTAWYRGKFWLTTSKQLLNVGQSLTATGQIQPFHWQDPNLSAYQKYLTTQGWGGQIHIAQIHQNQICRLECRFFKTIHHLKTEINYKLTSASCHQFYLITRTLHHPNHCQDPPSLITGLLFGGTQGLSQETKQAFQTLNLSHIVAVSGYQVVLLSGFIENLGQHLQQRRQLIFILTCTSLFLFICLVGLQPPILRAGLSTFISRIVLIFLGRKLDPWRITLYSAGIMLLFNPLYLFSISFQLSVTATLGLHLFPIHNQGFIREQIQTLLSTVSVFLITLPIISQLNDTWTPVGFLANLIILPLTGWTTLTGILSILPIPVFTDLCTLISLGLSSITLRLSNYLATLPISFGLPKPTYIDILVFYLFLGLLSYLWHQAYHTHQIQSQRLQKIS